MNTMRKIVAARIDNTRITNSPIEIVSAIERGKVNEFLELERIQFLAHYDLGPKWTALANGPVLFLLDDDGKPYPPDYQEGVENEQKE